MKKIFFFLLLTPSLAFAQLELPFPVKVVNPKPLDFWYYESDGTPYDNTTEAITQVISAVRYRGLTVNVNGVEYWWKDGTADLDLVAKGGATSWASITGKPAFFPADTTLFWKTSGLTNLLGDTETLFTGDSTNIKMVFGEEWGELWGLKVWKGDVSYGSQLNIGYDFVEFYNQTSPSDPIGLSTNGFTVGNGVGFYSTDFNTFGSKLVFKDSIFLSSYRRIQFYKQNEEDPFSETEPTLVADFGNDIRLPIIAADPTETWSLVIDEDGIVTSQPSGGGATNLAFTPSSTNGIVTSDTGTDATIPLGNGTNSGLSLNDYTTAEKSKLAAITGTNTGDQTSIVGITGTKAQFNTAVTDGDIQYVGDAPTAHTLDSHSNVTIASNSAGELLKWNGSAWINNTLAEAGIQPAGSYLTSEVDGSVSNEGSLTVGAGTGTTSIINSNTSGSTAVTITAGTGLSIGEAGNVITLTNTGVITEVDGSTTNELQTITNTSDATSHTVTLSNSGGSIQLIEGSGITLTTGGSGSAGTVTIASTGGGGFSDPMTTAGDIIIRDGSNTTTRLAAGTNTHVLTLSGGVPVWAAPPGAGSGLTYAQSKALKFK